MPPQPRVSFDPSLTRPEPVRSTGPRLLSYSEVAALHAGRQGRGGRVYPPQQGRGDRTHTPQQGRGDRTHTPQQGRGDRTHLPQHANLKTLHVKGIPDELNTNAVLRKHFTQFGEVKLLKCFPSKKYATVEFATRVSVSVVLCHIPCLTPKSLLHRKIPPKQRRLGRSSPLYTSQ